MPVHQHHSGWRSVTALSWRVTGHRFSFIAFLFLACGLLVLGRTHPLVVQSARGHLVESVEPLLEIVARPIDYAAQFTKRVNGYMALQTENEKLRIENMQMKQWENAVVSLDRENKELRKLLHFKAEPNLAYVSARVIADTGGPFVRALIVTAGKADGVREGMAAMTGDGLVGRVVEVSDKSSRVLMITDLNSRLPVVVAESGDNAIVAGDNTSQLKLLYLPQDAVVQNGSRILTSGHGGVFPPNLPVGVISTTKRGIYNVVPMASLGHISYVNLIDFNLAGGVANPIANKLNVENAKP